VKVTETPSLLCQRDFKLSILVIGVIRLIGLCLNWKQRVSDCVFGGKTRAIKVIHGHGTGALKRGVREWCEDQTGRFQAVIIGENYDLFDPESAGMRADCGSPRDPDLGRRNGAVTYIWLW
jgi:Smr domain.